MKGMRVRLEPKIVCSPENGCALRRRMNIRMQNLKQFGLPFRATTRFDWLNAIGFIMGRAIHTA